MITFFIVMIILALDGSKKYYNLLQQLNDHMHLIQSEYNQLVNDCSIRDIPKMKLQQEIVEIHNHADFIYYNICCEMKRIKIRGSSEDHVWVPQQMQILNVIVLRTDDIARQFGIRFLNDQNS